MKELDCASPAECRHAFLSEVSAQLAASLDHEETLRIIARMAIPALADWVAIDVITGSDQIRRVIAEPTPEEEVVMSRWTENAGPVKPAHGFRKVIETGETDFIPEVTDELAQQLAENPTQLKQIREARLRSVISAPLRGRDHNLGAMTFARVGDQGYTQEDVEMVEEVAKRVATALENAWVVGELRTTRERLERQTHEMEEKGHQLEVAMQRLRMNIEQSPLGVIDTDPDGIVTSWNPAAERIFGYSAKEAIGEPISFIFQNPSRLEAIFPTISRDRRKVRRTAVENVKKSGERIVCTWYATPIVDRDDRLIAVSGIVADTTYRKEMEDEVQRQLERLNALRAIDMAITASMDLNVTLAVLLDQVVSQLNVDAADILLVNEYTQRLQFVVSRGFRTTALKDVELALGEGTAGKSALDRRTIALPAFENSNIFTRQNMIEAEEFVSYYCTPLISKGRVTGVLEVYSRTPMNAGPDWIAFFETLAGQAAIAVDNAQLFENLQESNLDLVLAYDSTLEGWARALDLRDGVTQGHSRRVTEMAERMARQVGIRDADLINVRRGALLHDIGKMGIPDAILHKKGPLTDAEWAIMKKHPVYAWELLHPIEFLRPALEIPCAHHEHWDGSGYPRGLAGKDIPLAARIFAIVDVWDALRSDRPYSKSWTEAEARNQIRDIAGSHLDPELVEIFLGMDWSRFHDGSNNKGRDRQGPPPVNGVEVIEEGAGGQSRTPAPPPPSERPKEVSEHEGRAAEAERVSETAKKQPAIAHAGPVGSPAAAGSNDTPDPARPDLHAPANQGIAPVEEPQSTDNERERVEREVEAAKRARRPTEQRENQ